MSRQCDRAISSWLRSIFSWRPCCWRSSPACCCRGPQPRRDDGVDPRAELVRRLLEYEQTKLAAAKLDAMPRVERDFEWIRCMSPKGRGAPTRGQPARPPACLAAHGAQGPAHPASPRESRRAVGARAHDLDHAQASGRRFCRFRYAFDSALGVPALVVGFLAVLELVKERLVACTQNEPFAPIYVKLTDADPEFA